MEMVLKFTSESDDVEVVSKNRKGNIIGKFINAKDCIRELIKICDVDYTDLVIDNVNQNVLYFERANNCEYYVINLPERKIKCTYKNKAYTLVHPNTIFVLNIESKRKIYTKMQAFCYKEYKGKDTALFRYPFPNMLGSDSICTGTISNDATDPIEAILNVIEGNYTHNFTSNNKIKDTANFFKAMKKEFQYDILEPNGITLETIIKRLRRNNDYE